MSKLKQRMDKLESNEAASLVKCVIIERIIVSRDSEGNLVERPGQVSGPG